MEFFTGRTIKAFRFLALVTLVGAVAACSVFQEEDDSSSSAGGTRAFYAIDFTNGETSYQVTADLYGVSASALVYVESGQNTAASIAQGVADEFDRAVYGTVRANYGTEMDFDQNGRVIVLLLDIKDGFSGSGGYIAGYFDPNDMLNGSSSNRGEVLYIDVDPATPGSERFFRTISHEFQHLVNFVENIFRQGGSESQDTWINEGLSLSAEYMYAGSHSLSRLSYYNNDPAGSIANGNNFYVWNKGDVLADYATAYIFFQWLRIQASNGAGIYREIITNTNNDYRAVEAAAETWITGSAVGIHELIRDWYLALWYRDDTGRYGFGGDSVLDGLTPKPETENDGELDLYPGEGVFDSTDGGSFTPSGAGPSIAYVGLGGNSATLDTVGFEYTGTSILSWNTVRVYNPDDPPKEEAKVPTASIVSLPPGVTDSSSTGAGGLIASSGGGSGGVAGASSEPPRIYPIGVRRRAPFDDAMERDAE